MHLQVKYGLITLINQEADLCETIEKADLKCPLEKGEMKLTKDVDLPKEIPPVRLPGYSAILERRTTSLLIHTTGDIHGSC